MPEIDDLTMQLINDIVKIHLEWQESMTRLYPHLLTHGRPVRLRDAKPGQTSLETYLRCELMTYSHETIAIYHRATLEKKKLGQNEAEENLSNQMRHYGFASLAEAEKKLSARAVSRILKSN